MNTEFLLLVSMNATIIVAHPEQASFSYSMARQSKAVLDECQVNYSFTDLYALNFQPVIKAEEFHPRLNPNYFQVMEEQEHAWHFHSVAPDVKAEQEKLIGSDLIIFHFPLWWWTVPAILKGWFDRVLSKGFAYGDQELLRGKKAMLVVTAETESKNFMINRKSKEYPLYHLEHGVLEFIGLEVLPAFVVTDIYRMNLEQCGRKLADYKLYLTQTIKGLCPNPGALKRQPG